MKRKIKITKTKEKAKSAQIVASIEDLLTEILLRLPSKSLTRFKSVSKCWLALITNPKFCLLRYPNPNPAVGLFLPCINSREHYVRYEYVPLCVNKSTDPPFKNFEFAKGSYRLKIVNSCNGLMLCYSYRSGELKRRYYVYNPTTSQFSKLPKLRWGTGVSYEIRGISLAFDPAKSDHYTVVCVLNLDKNSWNCLQIKIYSSDTGSWRVCGESFIADNVVFKNGVYWNGSIHWISDWNEEALYFNIDHQMLEKMPAPLFTDGWQCRSNYFFGESCDHLHFIDTCVSQIKFDVYEMKKDYSEWFVKYHVDLWPVLAVYTDIIPTDLSSSWYQLTSTVFCVIRGKKEEDSFLVLRTPLLAIRYNLVYKTFERLHEFEFCKFKNSYSFPVSNGFQYIESLNRV